MVVQRVEIIGGEAGEAINGSAGDDKLYGNGGNDTLWGGFGDDLLDGGDGDDTLWDNGGNNHLLGGAGNDYLNNHGDGATTLDGGTGHDHLVFGRTSTVALGGDGNDRIEPRNFESTSVRIHTVDGGNGDDYIQPYLSSLATFLLTGGAGRDTFDFLYATDSREIGEVVITDFQTGIGGDTLTVDIHAGMMATFAPTMLNPFVAGFVRFKQYGADTLFQTKIVETLKNGVTRVSEDFFTIATLRNVVSDSIVVDNIEGRFDPYGAPSLPVRLEGSALPDRLRGGLSADYIDGGDGKDVLTGGAGDDEMHGGAGDDHLNGGVGNDVLFGGDGKDFLNGAEGDDQLWGGSGDDYLSGDMGADTLHGGAGNDTISGGHGNDFLSGGDGNDELRGDLGSNHFDGGAGLDLVFIGNLMKVYQLKRTATGFELINSAAPGGPVVEKLVNVERLKFGGDPGTYALDIDGNAGQAYRLYQAAFNRTPDAAGLKYWINVLDQGAMNLQGVSASFIASAEFVSTYGSAPSNAFFLDKLYDNILHRKPDPAGYIYWLNVLDQKLASPTDLLVSFSESQENIAALVGTIGNGFWIA